MSLQVLIIGQIFICIAKNNPQSNILRSISFLPFYGWGSVRERSISQNIIEEFKFRFNPFLFSSIVKTKLLDHFLKEKNSPFCLQGIMLKKEHFLPSNTFQGKKIINMNGHFQSVEYVYHSLLALILNTLKRKRFTQLWLNYHSIMQAEK